MIKKLLSGAAALLLAIAVNSCASNGDDTAQSSDEIRLSLTASGVLRPVR